VIRIFGGGVLLMRVLPVWLVVVTTMLFVFVGHDDDAS
jgi:hypothetical protein